LSVSHHEHFRRGIVSRVAASAGDKRSDFSGPEKNVRHARSHFIPMKVDSTRK
jgi:hypothetical protein